MAFEVVEADGLHLVRSTALRARHAFSTRIGGVSESPFDRLNMGLSAGDEADRVRENRERFRAAGGFSGAIAVAHQVHGAIGTALEHDLHRFTRAALAWRGEFGSVGYWDRRLAAAAAAAGPGGLWPFIAG